jgi:hypothetical protein
MTNNPSSFSFKKIEADLNKEGYNTYILPVNKENAVEQLLVSTMTESEAPVIQIVFVNDLLAASGMVDAMNDTFILQFFAALPLQADKAKIGELYQLITVFSRVLPVGAFGLSEDGGIYFRYSLMSLDRNISSRLVVELVKLISFFINKFSVHLNSFISGRKSLNDVLQESQKEMNPAV